MGVLTENVAKTWRHYALSATRDIRSAWWDLRREPARGPIFVVGCSRAGTTLVYKTLSESAELGTLQRETHDYWEALHPLTERDWRSHALTAADATATDWEVVTRYFYSWTGMSRWVDKNNQNGLCVSYLHELFPDACFVYVKRSPGDNLHSLIEGWDKPDEFATWSDELPGEVRIDAGRYRRWCFFLPEGWREYLRTSIEDVCAFQYASMNGAILDAKRSIAPECWFEVRYEDLVQDPVGGFRSMVEACALKFDSHLERHCATVLDRPYNAFSEIRLDKWKSGANRERIERVLPQLESLAHRMGYDRLT